MLSFIPILHRLLQLIKFYSPSLRWFASTDGLRLLSFMPILHLSLHLIGFYSPSLRWFLQALTGSDRTSYRPILLHLLHLIGFYSPSLRWFSQVPVSLNCSLSCLYCICRFSLLISTVLPATILIFLFFSFCFSPIQFLMSESVIFPSGK